MMNRVTIPGISAPLFVGMSIITLTTDFIEVAIRNGSAAAVHQLKVGDPLIFKTASESD